jgi:exonuclease SbcC
MHVHSLEFAAIGPFAGAHRIDFDGLGGASLFLIDGPTGAGKSTIIDALVFALFGDVAGRTSDKQRLRSAFARDEDETYAEVEFSTSFGRFRVRRTPEYGRAKRRGTGTTTVPSSVVLMRSVGEQTWESISTHKGEADAEIQRVIGLTRAQFLQTVVLPQGEQGSPRRPAADLRHGRLRPHRGRSGSEATRGAADSRGCRSRGANGTQARHEPPVRCRARRPVARRSRRCGP